MLSKNDLLAAILILLPIGKLCGMVEIFLAALWHSEIGPFGLRNREQVLPKMIPIVFGTDHLQERVRHLAPAPHHVERFVESVGVVDFDPGFQRPAIGGQLKALAYMQLPAMRCTEPIGKTASHLKPLR